MSGDGAGLNGATGRTALVAAIRGRVADELDPDRGPGPWAFGALCALLAIAFYAPFVLHPERMLFGTDMLGQGLQMRHFALEEVRAGRGIPLWNPFLYGGLPYLAVLPGPLFYPTSLLYLVAPLGRAIGWTFVFHSFLAGLLAYLAARSFGLRRWSAAVAGLAFMFTGYMLSHLYGGHDGRMFAMALIPGAFALLERGLRREQLGPYVGLGLVIALQLLTPHAQIAYFSSLALVLYAGYRLALRWAEGEDRRRAVLAGAGRLGLAFVVAAAVAAVQVLPTVALLPHGVRGAGQGGYEFAASFALPPQELSALFLPDLVGSLPDRYWGTNPLKLHTEYLGAGVVGLALAGLLGSRREHRRVWFLAGAAVLGIAFALGPSTPVHHVAHEVVPLVDRFRAPSMMLGPVAFFVTLLAGVGVERALEERGGGARVPWGRVWIASAPFLLLALFALLEPEGLLRWVRNAWYPADHPRSPGSGLAADLRATGGTVLLVWTLVLGSAQAVAGGRLPVGARGGDGAGLRIPVWALSVVLVLLVADLWRVDARYLETVPRDEVLRAGPSVEALRAGLGPGERVWPLERSFGPNELMYHRIPTVTGSQNFRLAWYDRLVGGVGYENLLRRPVLWTLFDIRFVTTRSELDVPLLGPARRHGGVALHEVRAEAPHAFFPDAVRPVREEGAALEATLALRDPRAAAVVEVAPGEEPPGAGRGTARPVRIRPDEVVLEVRAEEGGLLFVSEVHHPSWRAYVDGEETEVHRVNAAFRGVEVPEGEHRVVLRYESAAVTAGAWISAAALLAALAGLLLGGVRRRGGNAG